MKTAKIIKAMVVATAILHSQFSIFNLSAQAATINQVIVRQQWPWSTDVKVEYQLEGVDSSHPVDLAVTAYNGDTQLDSSNLASAIRGDVYGITEEFGEFYIDPVAAFGSERIAMTKFKVKLALSDSAANIKEVLYKIYDLTSGSCTDVTRADLLGHKYGSIETNYTAFTGFNTPVSDVLIWTGVTNDAKYATTHLVLRKIPAAGQTFTMGSPSSEVGRTDTDTNMASGRETQHSVTFNNDFYIGVFEVTQQQWFYIKGNWPSKWSLEACKTNRPVEFVSYNDIRGSNVGATWPEDLSHDVDGSSFLGLLRDGLVDSPKLDLPTEAQWEYACRAQSTSGYYNGKECENAGGDYTSANLSSIARYRKNGGYPSGTYPSDAEISNSDTSGGTAKVGSYMPNAWGLYDMLGNVAEWCLDYYGAHASDPLTEPAGPAKVDAWASNAGYQARLRKGGYCTSPASECRAAFRTKDTWNQRHFACGLRLCLTVVE